jgi:hypothetical protein
MYRKLFLKKNITKLFGFEIGYLGCVAQMALNSILLLLPSEVTKTIFRRKLENRSQGQKEFE